MKKKALLYGSLFIAMICGFFVFIFWGNDLWKAKLPVMSYVQPFSFTDQRGLNITQGDVNGKVYVAEYFFTTCKGICPKMNTNLKAVYDKYLDRDDLLILSHSVDPETDSVERLKFYADSLGVKAGKWIFLTGRKDSLYHAARVSYLLDDPENSKQQITEQFIHTQFFALVDRLGRVRGIYDGLKKDELNKLTKDIDEVLKEKGGSNFVNSIFN